MVDDDVVRASESKRVRRAAAESKVAENDVVAVVRVVDVVANEATLHDDATWRRLTGNGELTVLDLERPLNRPGYVENHGSRARGAEARLQRARTVLRQRLHSADRSTAPSTRVRAKPLRTRKRLEPLRRGGRRR